jgi:hypothetical protein
MRRREAIVLFRKISECIPDSFISGVSLTPLNCIRKQFELRINVNVDAQSITVIRQLVEKRGMALEEDKGTLWIHEVENEKIQLPMPA